MLLSYHHQVNETFRLKQQRQKIAIIFTAIVIHKKFSANLSLDKRRQFCLHLHQMTHTAPVVEPPFLEGPFAGSLHNQLHTGQVNTSFYLM